MRVSKYETNKSHLTKVEDETETIEDAEKRDLENKDTNKPPKFMEDSNAGEKGPFKWGTIKMKLCFARD